MYLFYPLLPSVLPLDSTCSSKKKKKNRKKKFFEDWVRITASNDTRSGMWNLPEIAYEVYFSPAFRTQELMIRVNRVLWTDAVQSCSWAGLSPPCHSCFWLWLILCGSLFLCTAGYSTSSLTSHPLPPLRWEYQECSCCCLVASVMPNSVWPHGL